MKNFLKDFLLFEQIQTNRMWINWTVENLFNTLRCPNRLTNCVKFKDYHKKDSWGSFKCGDTGHQILLRGPEWFKLVPVRGLDVECESQSEQT